MKYSSVYRACHGSDFLKALDLAEKFKQWNTYYNFFGYYEPNKMLRAVDEV